MNLGYLIGLGTGLVGIPVVLTAIESDIKAPMWLVSVTILLVCLIVYDRIASKKEQKESN